MTLENMVNVLAYQKDFEAFLLDLQHRYRIERSLTEDPNDRLLTATRVIDDILHTVPTLEEARKQYLEEKRRQEREEEERRRAAEEAAQP